MRPRERLRDLIKQVSKVADETGALPPGEFLATVAAGIDPRPIDSPLYTIVHRIASRGFSGGDPMPTMDEWMNIQEIVLNSGEYKKSRVSIEQSLQAATKLMDFLHAKMKAVELTGDLDVKLEVKPLTGADLDAFKERFEDEF